MENKKIISGKINNALSNDSHLYRGGVGNKNITYGHLYCTQEVSNQIMLLTILHEMVDFKKNQQDFTAMLVYNIKTTMAEHNSSSHLSA